MTSNAPAPRGNLALGVALGAVVGILVVVFAWLQLVPRTAEPAPDRPSGPVTWRAATCGVRSPATAVTIRE